MRANKEREATARLVKAARGTGSNGAAMTLREQEAERRNNRAFLKAELDTIAEKRAALLGDLNANRITVDQYLQGSRDLDARAGRARAQVFPEARAKADARVAPGGVAPAIPTNAKPFTTKQKSIVGQEMAKNAARFAAQQPKQDGASVAEVKPSTQKITVGGNTFTMRRKAGVK